LVAAVETYQTLFGAPRNPQNPLEEPHENRYELEGSSLISYEISLLIPSFHGNYNHVQIL